MGGVHVNVTPLHMNSVWSEWVGVKSTFLNIRRAIIRDIGSSRVAVNFTGSWNWEGWCYHLIQYTQYTQYTQYIQYMQYTRYTQYQNVLKFTCGSMKSNSGAQT